jgi:hypothetical protein
VWNIPPHALAAFGMWGKRAGRGWGVDVFTHLDYGGIHKDTTRNRWLLVLFDIKIG